ncbi:hypothetical protein AGOR_G00183070 [Albula goreensis]|uniref:AIG1-type G domain-containing protein n=1 Tax=Albula goreensis TaxID=1534307 RepID=A0A8T3D0S0_9TELE|nr:hypothetical protein AGOR_G00183070 [Albula goreensis]
MDGSCDLRIVLLDELNDDSETVTIEQFVDTDSYLKALIKDCGNRVHVIDNKYWERDENAERIKNLLTQIDQMKEQNGEYTFVATYSPNCRIA